MPACGGPCRGSPCPRGPGSGGNVWTAHHYSGLHAGQVDVAPARRAYSLNGTKLQMKLVSWAPLEQILCATSSALCPLMLSGHLDRASASGHAHPWALLSFQRCWDRSPRDCGNQTSRSFFPLRSPPASKERKWPPVSKLRDSEMSSGARFVPEVSSSHHGRHPWHLFLEDLGGQMGVETCCSNQALLWGAVRGPLRGQSQGLSRAGGRVRGSASQGLNHKQPACPHTLSTTAGPGHFLPVSQQQL